MEYDSIIVHGAGGKIVKSRLDTALDLYFKKEAGKLIFTGRDCTEPMKNYASKRSVPQDDILLEESSKDSIGDIFFTKKNHLEPNKWNENIVVSSEWHLPRLNFICKKVLGENYYTKLVGSKDEITEQELRELKQRENFRFLADKLILLGIKPGDDESIGERLSAFYYFYNFLI